MCDNSGFGTHNHDLSHEAAEHVRPEEVAECPVMKGSTVVKAQAEAAGLVREYAGQRYWLCCAGCGPKFDADPPRYAVA